MRDGGARLKKIVHLLFIIPVSIDLREILSVIWKKGLFCSVFSFALLFFKEFVLGKGEDIENLPPVTQQEGCWCGHNDLIVLPLPDEVAYQTL